MYRTRKTLLGLCTVGASNLEQKESGIWGPQSSRKQCSESREEQEAACFPAFFA